MYNMTAGETRVVMWRLSGQPCTSDAAEKFNLIKCPQRNNLFSRIEKSLSSTTASTASSRVRHCSILYNQKKIENTGELTSQFANNDNNSTGKFWMPHLKPNETCAEKVTAISYVAQLVLKWKKLA